MNRNRLVAVCLAAVAVIAAFIVGMTYLGTPKAAAQAPAPTVVEVPAPRPVTEVACGQTYEFEHTELYEPKDTGRVARNFSFGGKDRGRAPQYIWAENVIGQSTEDFRGRTVDARREYSSVTFLCLDDPMLEGHRASNIEIMKYRLNLRRPLRPQHVIRNGGEARR